ncbi:MAG: hypothetical protein EXR21_10385 [Flavobacteriaceae bacterium]|nr:hypothetical protein [Flavobacteriaceae bacterium]
MSPDEHDNQHYQYYHDLMFGADGRGVPLNVPPIGSIGARPSDPLLEHDQLGMFYVLENTTASAIDVSFLNPNNIAFLSSSNTYLYSDFTFPLFGNDYQALVVGGSTTILDYEDTIWANITALVATMNTIASTYGTWTVVSSTSMQIANTTYTLGMLSIGALTYTPTQTDGTGITFQAATYPYRSLLTSIGAPDGMFSITNLKINTNSTAQSIKTFTIAYSGDYGVVQNYPISPFKYMDGGMYHPTILDVPTAILAGKQNINFNMLAGSKVTFVFDLVKTKRLLEIPM